MFLETNDGTTPRREDPRREDNLALSPVPSPNNGNRNSNYNNHRNHNNIINSAIAPTINNLASNIRRVNTAINVLDETIQQTANAHTESLLNNGTARGTNNTAAAAALPNSLPELEASLSNQLSNLSTRVKFTLPLIFLLILKYIFDNFLCCILTLFIMYNYEKLKYSLQQQIALKERSDLKTLLSLVGYLSGLLATLLYSLHLLNYNQSLIGRLILSWNVPKESLENGLFQLIWDCFITDLTIHMTLTIIKGITCICIDQKHSLIEYVKTIALIGELHLSLLLFIFMAFSFFFLFLFYLDWFVRKLSRSPSNNRITAEKLVSNTMFDLENQSQCSPSNLRMQELRPLLQQRRVHSNLSNPPSSSSSTSSQQQNQDSDTDTSDSADPQLKLTRLRLFSLIEISFFMYRSLVPIPLWGFYFSFGNAGSKLFTMIYCTIKIIDLSWKSKGALEAFETFLGQKLVNRRLSFLFFLISLSIASFILILGIWSLCNNHRI
jgi:hypothetical protein